MLTSAKLLALARSSRAHEIDVFEVLASLWTFVCVFPRGDKLDLDL